MDFRESIPYVPLHCNITRTGIFRFKRRETSSSAKHVFSKLERNQGYNQRQILIIVS